MNFMVRLVRVLAINAPTIKAPDVDHLDYA